MEVREFLRIKLAERGMSMKEASERIGRNHAYLQQFLERGIPASLPEDVREELAGVLGVNQEELRGPAPARAARAQYIRLPPANPGDRIPVMGIAEGGGEGKSLWNGEVVDYVPRPPALSGAPNGYATYVVGHSMEPRYHPGELIYVHPGKPVNPGAYVLVQLRPPEEGSPPLALIKRLVRKTATKIVLEQFNPPRQFDVAVKDLVSIHRITGSGE